MGQCVAIHRLTAGLVTRRVVIEVSNAARGTGDLI